MLRELQDCQYVCQMVDSGKTQDGRGFIVMELLGKNLAQVVSKSRKEIGIEQSLDIARDILHSILELHKKGYIHRDIKPANFVQRLSLEAQKPSWVLLDFGLARKYIHSSGEHLKQRTKSNFRGSVTYASLNSHNDSDLSRRDDLWSWFYILVELIEGMLLYGGIW